MHPGFSFIPYTLTTVKQVARWLFSCLPTQLVPGSPVLVQARPLGRMKNSRTWRQAFSIPLLPAPPSHLGLRTCSLPPPPRPQQHSPS